jgi:hypothetical protein
MLLPGRTGLARYSVWGEALGFRRIGVAEARIPVVLEPKI